MIEIKLEHLRNPQFIQAYGKLMQTPGMEPKVAYHIGRVGNLLEQELKAANDAHSKLVQVWAEEVTENEGTDKEQKFFKVPDAKIADWTMANMNFHQAVVSVDKKKIQLKDIEKASLTPSEFLALEPVITESELHITQGGQDGEKES